VPSSGQKSSKVTNSERSEGMRVPQPRDTGRPLHIGPSVPFWVIERFKGQGDCRHPASYFYEGGQSPDQSQGQGMHVRGIARDGQGKRGLPVIPDPRR
jgi:hypothetical protein